MNPRQRIIQYSFIISTSIIVLMMGVFIIGRLQGVSLFASKENVETEKANYQLRKELERQEEDYLESLKGKSFSEKIENGDLLSVLIIADEAYDDNLGFKDEPLWMDDVISSLESTYGIEVKDRYLPLNGGGYAWGWQLFRQLEVTDYDLLVLDHGFLDKVEVDFLELLIQDVVLAYSDILILGLSGSEDVEVVSEEHASIMKDYRVHTINQDDVNRFIKSDGLLEMDLSNDRITHPSDQTDLEFKPEPVSHARFDTVGNLIVSTEKAAVLQYDLEADHSLVTYIQHPDGGELSFFLDEELVERISTRGELISTKVFVLDSSEASRLDIIATSYKDEYVALVRIAFSGK